MAAPSKLDPDEERLVKYFASRTAMPFGEAQKLRSSIATCYEFEDLRLADFAKELLRRSGVSKTSQPAADYSSPSFNEKQESFLKRAISYLTPGFDLGPPAAPKKENHSTNVSALTVCYSCKSAEGKPKKVYRSRFTAEQAAQELGRIYIKTYRPYSCLVQSNWWHLSTVKPTNSSAQPSDLQPPQSLVPAAPPKPSPTAIKVQQWIPHPTSERFELDLRNLAARVSLDSSNELNLRVQSFLIEKLQTELLRSTYRWIHIDALDSIIDAKTAIIYSSEYVHLKPSHLELHFGSTELHIANKYISWR